MKHLLLTFSILLSVPALAAKVPKLPDLKNTKELREACDRLKENSNRVLGPEVTGCSSFSGSLATARTDLRSETLEGAKNVEAFCRELADKLDHLQDYRKKVAAACTATGVTTSMNPVKSKLASFNKLGGSLADSEKQIAGESASCAGKLVPLVRKSSPDNMITPATVPEPAPADTPKENYPKLYGEVSERVRAFTKKSNKSGGVAAYSEDKGDCGQLADRYTEFGNYVLRSFNQMTDLIAREEGSTVHDLENYRRTATAMMNKGKAVDATVKTQTSELPAKHYNQSDD